MFSQIQSATDLLGLPLPSDDPLFIALVIIHILLSLIAVIFGLTAMLANKNSLRHSRVGRFYYWSIITAFITVIALAILRWPHNNHLLIIGFLTTVVVVAGRKFALRKPSDWARFHTICMACSYILLLTGFYVDNGEHLPFWNRFPQWFFYVFPSIVGVPIIIRVLKKHPMTRRTNILE